MEQITIVVDSLSAMVPSGQLWSKSIVTTNLAFAYSSLPTRINRKFTYHCFNVICVTLYISP